MENRFLDASNNKFEIADWVPKTWENMNITKKYSEPRATGLKAENLQSLNDSLNLLPTDFNFHPQIKKIFEARHNSLKNGKGIDWATAEALAWATLIKEGFHVRLSGQDV